MCWFGTPAALGICTAIIKPGRCEGYRGGPPVAPGGLAPFDSGRLHRMSFIDVYVRAHAELVHRAYVDINRAGHVNVALGPVPDVDEIELDMHEEIKRVQTEMLCLRELAEALFGWMR